MLHKEAHKAASSSLGGVGMSMLEYATFLSSCMRRGTRGVFLLFLDCDACAGTPLLSMCSTIRCMARDACE